MTRLSQALSLMAVLSVCILPIRPVKDGAKFAPAVAPPAGLIGGITTNLSEYASGQVPRYQKFEVSFDITSTTATNPYFPYDPSPPPGVEVGTGITVDALLLPPGETNWNNAKILPCFFYQPVEEVGSGDYAALLPVGAPEWRCRFTPEIAGTWQYKIRATDADGTSESTVHQFACAPSNNKGFVRTSATDPRFFEFADGTPFMTPLISIEQGNPFNTLTGIRATIRNLGENGIRFVRWFPTGEGASFFVAPFGDNIRINWGFGNGWTMTEDVDIQAGKKFSFRPYYYSAQTIPVVAGTRYRLSFRAKVVAEQVLRAQIGDLGSIDICSSTSTNHESGGDSCNYKRDGWHDYSIEIMSTSDTALNIALRGLYVSSDAPPPYDSLQDGNIAVHSVQFQRDETGSGGWSPNLLSRSDPDTYNYVDQRATANLDEILSLSEQYGVYHKLTLFHKNDEVLNRFEADGSVGDWHEHSRRFYSAEGQASRWYQRAYTRYFIARWSYSPALHSLELANENHLFGQSYDAGFAVAEYVHDTSPRHILMSNSFWGFWIEEFWNHPTKGHLLDYSDKHWYASQDDTDPEVVSNTWTDSAAYVRECITRFSEYASANSYNKPIVRGEGGVWGSSQDWQQHPAVATDPQGTYYHKKLWSHVGILGYTCDGEWYPRLLPPDDGGQFPNDSIDLFKMFSAYENFMKEERLNNGHYQEIGTDLAGNQRIAMANQTGNLRAWGARSTYRALLWIDNADHTWKNVVDGAAIPPASATLMLPGFLAGKTYTVQWWDPYQFDPAQQIVGTEFVAAQPDGSITIRVDGLATDSALKITTLVEMNEKVYLPIVLTCDDASCP